MATEVPVEVSVEEFVRDRDYYLEQIAKGRQVSLKTPGGGVYVIVDKDEFEGYKATSELLEHPEDREAIRRSLDELSGRHG